MEISFTGEKNGLYRYVCTTLEYYYFIEKVVQIITGTRKRSLKIKLGTCILAFIVENNSNSVACDRR